jgi:hypothetical protein
MLRDDGDDGFAEGASDIAYGIDDEDEVGSAGEEIDEGEAEILSLADCILLGSTVELDGKTKIDAVGICVLRLAIIVGMLGLVVGVTVIGAQIGIVEDKECVDE